MGDAQNFGRYRVTGSLGAGAMGEVYAAVDDVLGREVAVKTLRAARGELAARLADERFRLEARAIAALTHPNIVQLYDLDLAADPPYLVMERVEGPSLKERLADGPLSEFELRAVGIQMANALAAAHARGVVHRDVKPANILAAGSGMWKLADFGVAHVPDSSLTMTGQFIGSPAYAPPEAIVRGQSGPEGDVFGLAATLYEAASGERAKPPTSALVAAVRPLRDVAPGVPSALAAAIDRALAIEPAERPSAAELALELAGRERGQPSGAAVVAAAVALPAPPPHPSKFRRMHAIAGAATLLAILVIALTRTSPAPPKNAVEPPPAAPITEPPRPSAELRIVAPPIRDMRAAKDWKKIVDKLRKHEFAEARRRLAEWEEVHGETTETRNLASQLDALAPGALESHEPDGD